MADYNPFNGKLAAIYEKAKDSIPELENIVALSKSFDMNNQGNSLTPGESVRNIKDNIVKIVIKEGVNTRMCTGLLITTNYFITIDHIAKYLLKDISDSYIETNDGKKIPIQSDVYRNDKDNDLALIKADIQTEDIEPVRFKVNTKGIIKGKPIWLYGPSGYRYDRGVVNIPSIISNLRENDLRLKDTFTTDIPDLKNGLGASGKVYVNSNGELEGICAYTVPSFSDGKNKQHNVTGGIKPYKVIALIEKVKRETMEMLHSQ
jgi:hypothetical protein